VTISIAALSLGASLWPLQLHTHNVLEIFLNQFTLRPTNKGFLVSHIFYYKGGNLRCIAAFSVTKLKKKSWQLSLHCHSRPPYVTCNCTQQILFTYLLNECLFTWRVQSSL